MIEVADTSAWPLERILPFVGDVIASFQRLAKRFPDDTSAAWLWSEWVSGRRKLWLVLDDGQFRACALTHINLLESSGKKEAILLDLAGDGVSDYSDELNRALEEWAASEGAFRATFVGREGWKPIARKYGYRHRMTYYSKDLSNGRQQHNQE